MEKDIEQPGIDLQKRLDEILEAKPERVKAGKRTYTVTWLKNGTIRKFSHIMVMEDDGMKRNVKLAAAVLLNNRWKLALHWAYWRWLYYVRDIGQEEVLAVLAAAKKKLPQEPYLLATILATGMTDLMMTMRRSEASSTQAGQAGGRRTR